MRLDKYLKVSRIIKRRTVANEACAGGRVSLNGLPNRGLMSDPETSWKSDSESMSAGMKSLP